MLFHFEMATVTSLERTLTDVQKVCKKATSNGLMTDYENILLTFQLHYHWLQSHHKVFI